MSKSREGDKDVLLIHSWDKLTVCFDYREIEKTQTYMANSYKIPLPVVISAISI